MRTREALELRAILDGGSKHVEALLKMARHRNQPTIISHLVRVTLQRAAAETLKEIVADPELDARVLRARLDPVFREAEDAASVHNALLGERAVAIHAVYLSMAGELEEYGHSYPFSMWPFRSLAYLDAIGVLDTWDEAIELSGKPYAEARAGYESLRVRTEARKFPYILTKMYGALPGRFYEQTVKHTARMRLARIALWLLERKQRTGSWPDALESSLPPDPFTNRPFYYRPRGAGVRLAADIPLNSEDYEELVWELD